MGKVVSQCLLSCEGLSDNLRVVEEVYFMIATMRGPFISEIMKGVSLSYILSAAHDAGTFKEKDYRAIDARIHLIEEEVASGIPMEVLGSEYSSLLHDLERLSYGLLSDTLHALGLFHIKGGRNICSPQVTFYEEV